MDSHLISLIIARMNRPLPGYHSHNQVMNHRKPIADINFEKLNPKKSAVLLHLYPFQEKLHISYIERPIYNGVHSNQISFPGGKFEEHDESLLHTAIREANEEVNVDPKEVEVIGSLSEIYIPPSNFLVKPYISFQKTRPNFIADIREVQQVIETPLEYLLSQELGNHQIIRGTETTQVKGYLINGKVMWGATAMITKELIDICNGL